jgi:hypothetical protein
VGTADHPDLVNATGVQGPHSLGDEGMAVRGAGEERLGSAHALGFACSEHDANQPGHPESCHEQPFCYDCAVISVS